MKWRRFIVTAITVEKYKNNYSFQDFENNLAHHLTRTNPENSEILSQTGKI